MSFVYILLAVFSIIGSVLGAGFMSGTEIYGFFARYGSVAYITIALNAVIFGLFIVVYGIKTAKNALYITKTMQKNYTLYICQLLITATMVAGANVILKSFGMPVLWSLPIISLFVFVCNLFDVKSANFFNVMVTVLAIVCFAFVAYDSNWHSLENSNITFLPFVMVAFYLIMNITGSETIISKVCENKSKKQIVLVGIFVCATLMLMTYLLVGIVNDGNMPLISVIKNVTFKKVYSVVVMLAMISTMLSSSVGAKRLFDFNNFFASFFVAIIASIISFVGFSNMVLYVYPIIGFLLFAKYVLSGFLKIFLKN